VGADAWGRGGPCLDALRALKNRGRQAATEENRKAVAYPPAANIAYARCIVGPANVS
jgi:hypothetical protein